MPNRTIDWGGDDSPYETYVDRDGNGRVVLAEDTSGATVLLEWNESAGEWQYGGPVNMDGSDIQDVGELSSASVSTEDALNSDIGDGVDYLDPRWFVRSDALVWIEHWDAFDNFQQSTSGAGSVGRFFSHTVSLDCGSTDGGHASINSILGATGRGIEPNYNKDSAMRMPLAVIDGVDKRTDYYTFGSPQTGNKGYGFKISNGDLLGVAHDGTTETTTTLVSGYSTGGKALRVEFVAGSQIEFFDVSGSLGTISTGLPSGTGSGVLWEFRIDAASTNAEQRRVRVGPDFRTVQNP
jgi:hypothetical protein